MTDARGRPAGDEARPGRLTLLPAVDVAAGRAAQVVGGGPDDPGEVARGWIAQGATWLHLVDLDRAFGRGDNADLLARLVEELPVPVQLSGGLADEGSIAWALGTGARRVVLASSVLADPGLVERLVAEHGDRVVVAVDVRDGQVVSRGTALDLGPVDDVLAGHPVAGRGVSHVLVADAGRDGSRRGSDVGLFARVAGLVHAEVTASGGVAGLDDLRALAALSGEGVSGAVLGAALYHGAFSLAEAQEVCR